MNAVMRWIDERIDITGVKRGLLDRRMPGGLTWWHTLGSATLTVFLVQLTTGIALAMYYSPSPDHAYDSIRYLERAVVSGATLRGIHHWGASAMVVLVLAHMIRVFSMGAYKYPREINWVLGVILLFIVLGFSFTGYLLPWDQKAYWATQVGTNIAGTTPVVGPIIVKLLRGGGQLGAATLARFFALHVLLLPMLLVMIAMLHLALVIRQGIAPRTAVLETDAPSRTTDAAYPAYYQSRYAASKGAGVPFWPNIIYKDVVVGVVVVGILVVLARVTGAGLEAPADPSDTLYVPRPEWYFLPFFQLLKLVPGSWESAVAVGFPAAIILVLLLLPFFDRKSIRSLAHRPFGIVSMSVVLAGSSLLIGAAVKEEPATTIVPESSRPLSSIERSGRVLFQRQQCSSCHYIAGQKKVAKKEDTPDAPDLTDVGLKHSTAWMHSFIEDPVRFHPDSKMPGFGPPTLTHQEIEEITRYLTTLRGPGGATRKPEFRDTFPEPAKPREKS
jgi:ubiquinol-cytochrome c reductase cytochrome b subunit